MTAAASSTSTTPEEVTAAAAGDGASSHRALGGGGSSAAQKGEEMLFYVGGVALLTLLVNGTSAGWLLSKLSMTAPSRASRHIDPHVAARMARACRAKLNEMMVLMANRTPLFDETRGVVDGAAARADFTARVEQFSTALREAEQAIARERRMRATPGVSDRKLAAAEKAGTLIGDALTGGGGGGGGGGSPIDELRLLVRSVFVRCVRAQYAELVEARIMPDGSKAVRVLLYSCDVAEDGLAAASAAGGGGHYRPQLWGEIERF
jgi:hypothetical protein